MTASGPKALTPPLRNVFLRLSNRARERRARIFRRTFRLSAETRILDLGSESGVAIRNVLLGSAVRPDNVYIADIDESAVMEGAKTFGFQPVVIREGQPLPFADGIFDIVYCSSVIEHATVPKADVWQIKSTKEFRSRSMIAQRALAREICRVGRGYFVQTPSRLFPIESHSWLPFLGWLPRSMLIPALETCNRYWIKSTRPDFNLLDRKDMSDLFPDATILTERLLGFEKSIIAVRGATASVLDIV